MATFITSKAVGETFGITIETTTGYWKYNHDGTDFGPYSTNLSPSLEVLNANGEFTLISCDVDGNVSGDITSLDLSSIQLTSLDITGLNVLQILYVNNNLLTSSVNDSLLAKLAANELANDWNSGQFVTTGGRTAAGTSDYDYLIANGWYIDGANLPVTGTGKLRVKGVGQL